MCFTIASKHKDVLNTTEELFGLKDCAVQRNYSKELLILKSEDSQNVISNNAKADVLLIPIENTAGFDALYLLHTLDENHRAFFYLQMKVDLPKAALTDVQYDNK